MHQKDIKRVVIIGGGFAGIRIALDLAKSKKGDLEILLISNQDYFEYYPAMYRVVIGSSPAMVKIPLVDIFEKTSVKIVTDTIVTVDPENKQATGISGKTYQADELVLAVGSESNYFNIEGLEEISFNFKSINKALTLRKRIHELFENHAHGEKEEALVSLHFVIVGGGASGVELAGELALYTRKLARMCNIPESYVTVDLVEASSRVLSRMSERVSRRAERRLRKLGVNVLANRTLIKGESWTVFLKDMNLGARTLIWTAGVKTNSLYEKLIHVFEFDGRGRVLVDKYLQAKGFEDVYIAGDNAATEYSGLAQTAIHNGKHIARSILRVHRGNKKLVYHPKPNAFDIPIGPGWAILTMGKLELFGWLPWLIRHGIDFSFYVSILSFRKAWKAFFAKPYHGDTLDVQKCQTYQKNL